MVMHEMRFVFLFFCYNLIPVGLWLTSVGKLELKENITRVRNEVKM